MPRFASEKDYPEGFPEDSRAWQVRKSKLLDSIEGESDCSEEEKGSLLEGTHAKPPPPYRPSDQPIPREKPNRRLATEHIGAPMTTSVRQSGPPQPTPVVAPPLPRSSAIGPRGTGRPTPTPLSSDRPSSTGLYYPAPPPLAARASRIVPAKPDPYTRQPQYHQQPRPGGHRLLVSPEQKRRKAQQQQQPVPKAAAQRLDGDA
jgi:hypothetical protein